MKCHQVQRQSSQRFTRGEQISEEETRTQNSCSQMAPKTACSFFQTCSFLFFFFFFVRGQGSGEGKKGVVIFLQGSSLALYIDSKQQNWESGCAEEEGYDCGIPGLVAMATRSRGLGPPLPWLGAAGGPGSGAQLLSRIPPPWAVETWAEGPAVSRWALGNSIPSPALSHCRRGPFRWYPPPPIKPLCQTCYQYLKS